jgi:hypothetical protein
MHGASAAQFWKKCKSILTFGAEEIYLEYILVPLSMK